MVLLVLALASTSPARGQTTDFARLSARLSEPGGCFSTQLPQSVPRFLALTATDSVSYWSVITDGLDVPPAALPNPR